MVDRGGWMIGKVGDRRRWVIEDGWVIEGGGGWREGG